MHSLSQLLKTAYREFNRCLNVRNVLTRALKDQNSFKLCVFSLLLFTPLLPPAVLAKQPRAAYRDPPLPLDQCVDDLIARRFDHGIKLSQCNLARQT